MPGDKMDVRSFGDALIATRDLDPVYCGLVGAKLPEPQLCRWLLAYWCFYHVGLASILSESEQFIYWDNMTAAAKNDPAYGPNKVGLPGDRWPRAAERRHFRGQKCVDAVAYLSAHHPESWVRNLIDKGSDKAVMAEVQTWPMFGPWIAFKAADMMERVYGAQVSFDPNLGLMYEEPRKGLLMLATAEHGEIVDGHYKSVDWWYGHLMAHFGKTPAPPSGDRPCGPQEVETALCKWKSYMGGYYWVGKDIHEQRAALAGWGATADRILAAYPPEVTQ